LAGFSSNCFSDLDGWDYGANIQMRLLVFGSAGVVVVFGVQKLSSGAMVPLLKYNNIPWTLEKKLRELVSNKTINSERTCPQFVVMGAKESWILGINNMMYHNNLYWELDKMLDDCPRPVNVSTALEKVYRYTMLTSR
jgi:hypothetical protein